MSYLLCVWPPTLKLDMTEQLSLSPTLAKWHYNRIKLLKLLIVSVQFSHSVVLGIPMNCSTPGFPVHHQLPELAQTHVHWVGDAIQLSHPLSSPLLLPSILTSIRVFSNESVLCMRWPKYWPPTLGYSTVGFISSVVSWQLCDPWVGLEKNWPLPVPSPVTPVSYFKLAVVKILMSWK